MATASDARDYPRVFIVALAEGTEPPYPGRSVPGLDDRLVCCGYRSWRNQPHCPFPDDVEERAAVLALERGMTDDEAIAALEGAGVVVRWSLGRIVWDTLVAASGQVPEPPGGIHHQLAAFECGDAYGWIDVTGAFGPTSFGAVPVGG